MRSGRDVVRPVEDAESVVDSERGQPLARSPAATGPVGQGRGEDLTLDTLLISPGGAAPSPLLGGLGAFVGLALVDLQCVQELRGDVAA